MSENSDSDVGKKTQTIRFAELMSSNASLQSLAYLAMLPAPTQALIKAGLSPEVTVELEHYIALDRKPINTTARS